MKIVISVVNNKKMALAVVTEEISNSSGKW